MTERVDPFTESSEWAEHLRVAHGIPVELDYTAAVIVHQVLHITAATGTGAPVDHWHGAPARCADSHVTARTA